MGGEGGREVGEREGKDEGEEGEEAEQFRLVHIHFSVSTPF